MKRIIIWIGGALVSGALVFGVIGCRNDNGNGLYTGIIEGEAYAVSAPISEKLNSLSVREGDHVQAGDELARIDTASLELQLKGLISKRTQIGLQLEELALNTAQVKDTRDHYSDTYSKNLELLKADAVSDQSVQDLKLSVDKWDRELKGLILKRETLLSQKEELGYKIDEMELMIGKGVLNSPAEGYIDKTYYSEGEYVPALRPVVQLVSLGHVWCYIYAGESAIVNLKPGMAVKAISLNRELPAKIEHINSQAEFTPKEVLTPENRAALVYGVRVGIDNPDGVLKIGMPVDITWN